MRLFGVSAGFAAFLAQASVSQAWYTVGGPTDTFWISAPDKVSTLIEQFLGAP